MRQFLLGAQVAAALVLLVGAALFVRKFAGEMAVPTGVDLEGLYSFDISLPEHKYQSREARSGSFAQIEAGVLSLAGIESAMVVPGAPPHFSINFGEPALMGLITNRARVSCRLRRYLLSSSACWVLRLLAGRAFVEDEPDDAIIVGKAWADRVLGSVDPVGQLD